MTVPPAPSLPPRQRRHSMKTVNLARQMYGSGDSWTPTQIRRYLAERGIEVALDTVRRWVIPGEAEVQRRMNLASYHRRKAKKTPAQDPQQSMLARMLELRRAGLSLTAIAAVMNLDFGLDLTPESTRYYVNNKREPRLPARRAERQAA